MPNDMDFDERAYANTVDLASLLLKMVESGGSDLHLSVGSPPRARIHGLLHPMSEVSLTFEDTKRLAYSVLTESQKKIFEEKNDLDFSFGIKGLSRFRANVYSQKGKVSAAFRTIPYEIRSFEDLGLPSSIGKLCERPRGLILVTGPTGSGKSTTLAAMLDKINRERKEHIITIEDPIEYLHEHKSCMVDQREVGSDTESFGSALRAALRQDPDVVLVGEMRDLETTETALRVAETGHLTFATLHTNSAASTINRIIDIFPAHQHAQIRTQLALVLEGILTQALIPNSNGEGRSLALEILIPNPGIRNLIREDKIHQIYNSMQSSEADGMKTFNRSLAELVNRKKITMEMALARSSNQDELNDLVGKLAKNVALTKPPINKY